MFTWLSLRCGVANLVYDNVKLDKKGFLFTLTAVLFFSILIIVSGSYLARNNGVEKNLASGIAANHIKFIEDSVVFEYYTKILDLKPGTIDYLGDGQVRIDFPNAGNLPTLENKTELARKYRESMQGSFSLLGNINVTLINFYPNFTIIPYQSTFMKEGGSLIFYNPNYSQLKKVSVELKVDKSIDDVKKITIPSDSGDDNNPMIKVKIRDNGDGGKKGKGKGEEIIDSEVRLDPEAKNSFIIDFIPNDFVRVDFGDFNNKDGTYIASVDDVVANITLFEVRYIQVNESVKAIGGNLSLDGFGFKKNTELVIAWDGKRKKD